MQVKYTNYTYTYSLTSKYIWHTIKGMRYTFKQFKADFPDDNACLELIFQNRFGDLKYCPKCGAETKFYRVKKRQCYACMHCGYQLHPLSKTIFRKSSTSLWNWFYAIYLFSVAKNGVSAKELERHLGVTYKTAWRMAKQIRLLMNAEFGILSGEIEVDETYIGGSGKNKKSFRNNSRDHQQVVFGMVERNGSAIARHVPSSGARALLPEIQRNIELNSQIYSYEYGAYKTLEKIGYKHDTVNHRQAQYRKDKAHTQTIEGLWSNMKRAMDGTYHVVSPKYLQSYVNEFVFRYNFRSVPVCPVLLERAARPV